MSQNLTNILDKKEEHNKLMKYFEENIAQKSSEDPNPENKDDFTNNSLQMVVK